MSNRAVALDFLERVIWLNSYRDGLLNVTVIFYVVSIAFAITRKVDGSYFVLAWSYVVLGIIFSLGDALSIGAVNRQLLFFISFVLVQVLAVRFIAGAFVF